jgi:PadR family transcriptional regulator, regulatory protein AphA
MKQTDYVILGLLSESPLTGYQIKKLIDIRFRFFWSESYGQIYPRLKSLKAQGFIKEIEPTGKQNRSQKTYQINKEGIAALHNWLEQPVKRESIRLEILLKMYFSHLLKADVMISHIRAFQQAHEKDLQLIEMAQKELETIFDQDPNHPYILKVIDFGKKVNEAYINWSRETIKFLASRGE